MTFETIELRKVENGVIVLVRTDDEEKEYVFDTQRKSLKFIKDLLENKSAE